MGMSDIGDEHYSKIMDVNTIVHIVVSLSVIVVAVAIGLMVFQVCCKSVDNKKEWHPWKGLVIHRGEDSAPLHEMDVECSLGFDVTEGNDKNIKFLDYFDHLNGF